VHKEAVAAAKLAICQKEAAEMHGAIEQAKSNVHAHEAEHAQSLRQVKLFQAVAQKQRVAGLAIGVYGLRCKVPLVLFAYPFLFPYSRRSKRWRRGAATSPASSSPNDRPRC